MAVSPNMAEKIKKTVRRGISLFLKAQLTGRLLDVNS